MVTIFEHIREALIIAALFLTGGCTGADDNPPLGRIPPVPPPDLTIGGHKADYSLPPKLSLCGEALDLKKRSVYERLEREFLPIVNHPAQVALWQRRAAVFFPQIEAGLASEGLPDDLKYLAVAESDLRPFVVSPSGALGIWQFMPATARHFGLEVTRDVDYRQLPPNSLKAASRYLRSLYDKFGSWALAMAAYNAGEGRIARALAGQNASDYYQLDLPRETERYVYRIAAIKAVLENSAGYGLDRPYPKNRYAPPQYLEQSVNFQRETTWADLAKKLGCDYKDLRLLNPHIRAATLRGPYQLLLPAGVQRNLAE